MLTDEELGTRLTVAFHEGTAGLSYAGPVPQVRRSRAGLVATSAMAAAAAVALVPTALGHDDGRAPSSAPTSSATDASSGDRIGRALGIPGLDLTHASAAGAPDLLYAALGSDLRVPDDAEKVDLGLPVDVYFAKNPAEGEPQVYLVSHSCPDTDDPCPTPPPTHVAGILAPGWSRAQLIDFLQHPMAYYKRAEAHRHHR
jgi:hypothetical protein